MLYYLVAMPPVHVAAMPFCFRITHCHVLVGIILLVSSQNPKPAALMVPIDHHHRDHDSLPFSALVHTPFLNPLYHFSLLCLVWIILSRISSICGLDMMHTLTPFSERRGCNQVE